MRLRRFGPLAMSVDAAIPDRFWPAVHWACSYVFSWILPLVALKRFVDGHPLVGGILSVLTLIDWFVAAKWTSIGQFAVKRRRPVGITLIVSGVVLLSLGVFLLASNLAPNGTEVASPVGTVPTLLRLQFYGDQRIPTQITADNVHFWWAQFSPSMQLELRDKDGNRVAPPGGLPAISPTWNVFVTLEKPTKFKQVISTFSNPSELGPTEIQAVTDRSFLFHSFKQIPAGVLEIKFEQ
jgi:hypothetical protein